MDVVPNRVHELAQIAPSAGSTLSCGGAVGSAGAWVAAPQADPASGRSRCSERSAHRGANGTGYAALTWQFAVSASDFPPLGSSTVTAIGPSEGVTVVVGNQGRPCRTTIRSPWGSPSGLNSAAAVPNTGSPNVALQGRNRRRHIRHGKADLTDAQQVGAAESARRPRRRKVVPCDQFEQNSIRPGKVEGLGVPRRP